MVAADASSMNTIKSVLNASYIDVQAFRSVEEFVGSRLASKNSCLLLNMDCPADATRDMSSLQTADCRLSVGFLIPRVTIPAIVAAIRAGAAECIEKPIDPSALDASVERMFAMSAVSEEASGERDSIRQRLVSLSPRERMVFEQIVAGRANKQVAFDLRISERTVESHRARVMFKMRATSLPELVMMNVASNSPARAAG